jgi:hypothetical protein
MNLDKSISNDIIDNSKLVKSFNVGSINGCKNELIYLHNGKTYNVDWNSRAHRQKRFHSIKRNGNAIKKYSHKIKFLTIDLKNISWWVAILFTLGSMVWLINGYVSMWPLSSPIIVTNVLSLTAFFGGMIFIFVGVSAYLEIINRAKYTHIRELALSYDTKLFPSVIHKCRRFFVHNSNHIKKYNNHVKDWKFLCIEMHNWGWWLNVIQLLGALIFFVACAVGVILLFDNSLSLYTWFWLPQMVGAVCFIISSLMAMIEVQEKIYLPALKNIGWYSALFNAVGAVGFFLCAYLGAYYQSEFIIYWGSDLSTFIGSSAFLISSYLMLIEVMNP